GGGGGGGCVGRGGLPRGGGGGAPGPAGGGGRGDLMGGAPARCLLGGVCRGTAVGLRASDQRGPLVLGRCARVAGGAGCGRRLSHGRRLPPPAAAARIGGRRDILRPRGPPGLGAPASRRRGGPRGRSGV